MKRKVAAVEISKVTGKPKVVRQDRGREAAKRQSKMTKEQWVKFQTQKYKDAWPKPGYMAEPREKIYVRDGGDGAYRQKTYEVVTRWTEKTRISYRPHAKAPGSKSHLRYEKYSKAKTVGEALRLGSYPIDWCFDYEHGFIKVLGGEIRDEPIDISKVADPKKMNEVDRRIYKWFRRELCRRCGLKMDDLKMEAAWNETMWQRAHRLLANRYAREILDEAEKTKKPVTREHVLRILKAWAFGRNTGRLNVMPKDKKFVWSDTLGMMRDRFGQILVTGPTRRYPCVCQVLTSWLRSILPPEIQSFTCTSINLNCNYAAKRHRDGNNFGPSLIAAVGDYTGGDLGVWPEDDRSSKLNEMPKSQRFQVDISENLVMFNGNSAHEVTPFTGERFSIVFFGVGCHRKAPAEICEQLRDLGFPLPAEGERPDRLLRRPRGYKQKVAGSLGKALKIWGLKSLEKKSRPFKALPKHLELKRVLKKAMKKS